MIKVDMIAAARPNFMKIAPLHHALSAESWCQPRIVHTGQHYDPNMSEAFFRDLELPHPHVHLGVGSGSHAEQMGGVMIAYEKAVLADARHRNRSVGRVLESPAREVKDLSHTPSPACGTLAVRGAFEGDAQEVSLRGR